MEEVIISIPRQHIKLRTKNVSEAIKKLIEVKKKMEQSKLDIIRNFAGIGMKDYSVKKNDWYEQLWLPKKLRFCKLV